MLIVYILLFYLYSWKLYVFIYFCFLFIFFETLLFITWMKHVWNCFHSFFSLTLLYYTCYLYYFIFSFPHLHLFSMIVIDSLYIAQRILFSISLLLLFSYTRVCYSVLHLVRSLFVIFLSFILSSSLFTYILAWPDWLFPVLYWLFFVIYMLEEKLKFRRI
jgi:hypothetical protein